MQCVGFFFFYHIHIWCQFFCIKERYLLIMLCRCSGIILNSTCIHFRDLAVWGNISLAKVNYFLMLAHCLAVAQCLYLSGDNKEGCSHTERFTEHRPKAANALNSSMKSNIASWEPFFSSCLCILLSTSKSPDAVINWNSAWILPLDCAFFFYKRQETCQY